MKEPLVSKFLKVTLYIIFVVGILSLVTLPFMLDSYIKILYDTYSVLSGYRTFILGFLTIVGLLGLWIVAELIGMLRTISSDPFIGKNAKALRRMGAVAAVVAMLFFAKCFYYVTILTLICGMVMLLCSAFAFTLADLFRQAVTYKEENDLTI